MIVQLFAREEGQTLFAFNTTNVAQTLSCQYIISVIVIFFGTQLNIQLNLSLVERSTKSNPPPSTDKSSKKYLTKNLITLDYTISKQLLWEERNSIQHLM